MAQTSQAVLLEIRNLIDKAQKDDSEWRKSTLTAMAALGATVSAHTTAIALLDQNDARQNKELNGIGAQIRSMELSQAKSAGIGAIVGAVIAGLPQIVTMVRTLAMRP